MTVLALQFQIHNVWMDFEITVQNKKYQKLKILSIQINRNYGLNVNLIVYDELGITVTKFEILNPKN